LINHKDIESIEYGYGRLFWKLLLEVLLKDLSTLLLLVVSVWVAAIDLAADRVTAVRVVAVGVSIRGRLIMRISNLLDLSQVVIYMQLMIFP